MNGTVKAMLFSILVMAVLSVGTLQRGSCGAKLKALRAAGAATQVTRARPAASAFPLESTTGFCSTHPTGVQPPAK